MFNWDKNKRDTYSLAYDKGWNDCWLGLDKANPYPINSIDYKQYEWGWNDASDLLDEYAGNYG